MAIPSPNQQRRLCLQFCVILILYPFSYTVQVTSTNTHEQQLHDQQHFDKDSSTMTSTSINSSDVFGPLPATRGGGRKRGTEDREKHV